MAQRSRRVRGRRNCPQRPRRNRIAGLRSNAQGSYTALSRDYSILDLLPDGGDEELGDAKQSRRSSIAKDAPKRAERSN